jgi:uncharacterized protein (DUF58 family)
LNRTFDLSTVGFWMRFQLRVLRAPRPIEFTSEGRWFIAIIFLVAFAALNTGNNLLYLLLGMMLSLLIASGILSNSTLEGLEVTRQPPSSLYARRPCLMGISLRNLKRRLPSFSIEVEDLVDGKPLDKKCYFLKLPSGKLQHTSYRHAFARRGRYTFTGFRVTTKFPFALIRKSRIVEAPSEVIVYPSLAPIGHLPPPRAYAQGEESRGQHGRRGEFHGLHEFRDGDDPRDVHWRSTAKKGRTMVREYEDESARRLTILLDNGLPGGATCEDARALDGLERAISLAGSLAADYLERGYSVRLVTRSDVVQWLAGPHQLARLLRLLALLEPAPEGQPFAAPPDGSVEPILVVRRGAPHAGAGRVVEA